MENYPLVSAIITTHNRLSLLKRAVESVKSQTYDNLEIIVVDDASTDGTESWCRSQSFMYVRITPENSKGGNYARNIGILNSSGEYIAFLDDDDYWLPEKISLQVELLEKNGRGVVHCNRILEYVKDDGTINLLECILPPQYQGNLDTRILYQITIITSALLVKREDLYKVGLFDEKCKFWQEYELSIRLAQLYPFDKIEYTGLVYRIDTKDPNRLTNKYYEWIEAVRYIYTKHKSLYKRLSVVQKIRVKILYWTDSSQRAKAVGLNIIARNHNMLSKIFNIPFRISDKIKIWKNGKI